uniref:BTB domain-containing protein n=1 Tax=Megaselia scalaris TaxID=36166 RepID=T1GM87_MEGSC
MNKEEQFNLKWAGHHSEILSGIGNMINSNIFVDCSLSAEGKSLKAHKIILSACSPYFAVKLQATLSYIYNGEVTVTRNFLDSFVKVAKTLQIKGIYDHSSTNKDPLNMKECAQEKIHMEESVPESYNNMKNPEIKSPISLIQKDSKMFILLRFQQREHQIVPKFLILIH